GAAVGDAARRRATRVVLHRHAVCLVLAAWLRAAGPRSVIGAGRDGQWDRERGERLPERRAVLRQLEELVRRERGDDGDLPIDVARLAAVLPAVALSGLATWTHERRVGREDLRVERHVAHRDLARGEVGGARRRRGEDVDDADRDAAGDERQRRAER